jgi:hypothetical protein
MSMNRCAINTTDGGPWLQVWEWYGRCHRPRLRPLER